MFNRCAKVGLSGRCEIVCIDEILKLGKLSFLAFIVFLDKKKHLKFDNLCDIFYLCS